MQDPTSVKNLYAIYVVDFVHLIMHGCILPPQSANLAVHLYIHPLQAVLNYTS